MSMINIDEAKVQLEVTIFRYGISHRTKRLEVERDVAAVALGTPRPASSGCHTTSPDSPEITRH